MKSKRSTSQSRRRRSKNSNFDKTAAQVSNRLYGNRLPTIITIDENECSETAYEEEEADEIVEDFLTPMLNNNRRSCSHLQGKKKNKKTTIFYQLANHVRTQYELREKAELFKECVDVRDRAKNLVVYKQCFIGSEAVDAMIYAELVSTRQEAIDLARRFARELNLFRHVRGKHPFKDEDLYYQYKEFTTCSSTHSRSDGNSTTDTTKSCYSSFDDYSFRSSRSSDNSSSNNNNNVANTPAAATTTSSILTEQREQRLCQMAKVFKECVHVQDRRFRLKTYKQCFVGKEAVDILVQTRLVKTRGEAVEFGRTLMRELNLFQHVTGDHAFSDAYLFYRYTKDGPANHRFLPMPLATL